MNHSKIYRNKKESFFFKIKSLIMSILVAGLFVCLSVPIYSNYRFDIENTSPVMAEIEVIAYDKDNKIINESKDELIKALPCVSKKENCLLFSKQVFSRQTPLDIKIRPTRAGQIVLTLKIAEPQGSSTIKLVYKKLVIDGKSVFSNLKIGHANPYYYKFEVDTNKVISINMNAKQHYKIKFDMLLSVIILAYLLSYKMINYISSFNLIDKYSRIDIVFVVIFVGLLFLPMSNISTAQKSVEENRMLAKNPSLFVDKMLNMKYGHCFESWFNDHFFGRSWLLKIFKNKPNTKENEKVFEGLENWIFYKEENSIRNFQNLDIFSEEELKNIGSYLHDIQNWCEQNGKKFYVIIPADKNKVYGEFYPKRIKKINPDSRSRANQLVKYIHQNYPDINIIYLQQTMLNNKDKGFLYWKNDTHWNDFGAYIGYLELMKMAKKDYPHLKISQETFPREEPFLGMMMGLGDEKVYEKIMYKSTNKPHNCYEIKNSDVYKAHECYNPSNKINMFLLRDSFSGEVQGQSKGYLPYLYDSFGKIHIKWRYAINYNDINELKESDIIVLEVIERHLPDLRNLTFPKE